MDEQQWLTCTEPAAMLEFLRGKASDRKLRLFAVACCRRAVHLCLDDQGRAALDQAEQYADRLADEVESSNRIFWNVILKREWLGGLRTSHGDAGTPRRLSDDERFRMLKWLVGWIVSALQAKVNDTQAALRSAPGDEVLAARTAWAEAQRVQASERVFQCSLLRDIISPFRRRPVAVAPSVLAWGDGSIPKLAQAIYDNLAFDRLPILADTAHVAGCTNTDILNHCRQAGMHVRGCWALDLLRGRE
jgi:hypothetical protein